MDTTSISRPKSIARYMAVSPPLHGSQSDPFRVKPALHLEHKSIDSSVPGAHVVFPFVPTSVAKQSEGGTQGANILHFKQDELPSR